MQNVLMSAGRVQSSVGIYYCSVEDKSGRIRLNMKTKMAVLAILAAALTACTTGEKIISRVVFLALVVGFVAIIIFRRSSRR